MIIDIMTIPVVQFSKEGYKTKGFWLKINCSQMELSNLENSSSVKLSKSQFSMSKIIRIFQVFFSLKNINLGAYFL